MELLFRKAVGLEDQAQGSQDQHIHDMNGHRPGRFRTEPICILTEHIRALQNEIVNTDVPVIRERFAEVVKLHSRSYPEVATLRDAFLRLAERLSQVAWMDSRGILAYSSVFTENNAVHLDHVAPTADLMAASLKLHLAIARELSSIIERGFAVTNFNTIDPEYNHLLQSLNDLEDDLQSLAHLKLNILFPRVSGMVLRTENTQSDTASSDPRYLHELKEDQYSHPIEKTL